MNSNNPLRHSQRSTKSSPCGTFTETSKSFDHLIRNIKNDDLTNLTHNNGDVYNVPWDLKKKMNLPNLTVTQEGDQYCAPWDLRLQEEKLKQQLDCQPNNLSNDEYNKPWDQKTLIKQLNTSNTSSNTSSTCSPQHSATGVTPCACEVSSTSHLLQPICINHLNLSKIQQLQNDQQKFSSLGSNSSCSSLFDDTRPLIKPRKNLSPQTTLTQTSSTPIPTVSLQQLTPPPPPPPPLPSQPAYMVTLEKHPWFHGKITRKKAEDLLHDRKIGSFLVRQSESGNQNDFSLSLVSASGCVHMRICMKNGEFILGQCSQPFISIIKMIEYYNKVEVPIKGAQHVKLTNPIAK